MKRTIATMSAAALAGAATFAAFQVLPVGSAGGQVPDPTVTLPDDPSTSSTTSTTVDGPTTTAPGVTTTTTGGTTTTTGGTTTTTNGETTTTTAAPGGPTTTAAPGGPTTTTTAEPGTPGPGLPQQAFLPLALAQEVADAAIAECANQGFPVTVAVVDASGVDILTARADGATAATVAVARGKAYASAGFKAPTAALAEAAKTNPALTGIPNFVILAGGQPITAAGNAVGAIGVSGAPSGEVDDTCAAAGIAAIADDLA